MTLEPGALRELHWHASAAEWAYVLEGNCRVTTIDPLGQCEIVNFGPGDVWYFPRGHGHSIQRLEPDTCAFLLVFDNGYFSEFGTFSIADWLGHVPAEVRELHWHPHAAEWQYYIKRMTVFGSHGRARTDEFAAGDVALGREPETVIDELGIAWHQRVFQMHRLAVERERFEVTGKVIINPQR